MMKFLSSLLLALCVATAATSAIAQETPAPASEFTVTDATLSYLSGAVVGTTAGVGTSYLLISVLECENICFGGVFAGALGKGAPASSGCSCASTSSVRPATSTWTFSYPCLPNCADTLVAICEKSVPGSTPSSGTVTSFAPNSSAVPALRASVVPPASAGAPLDFTRGKVPTFAVKDRFTVLELELAPWGYDDDDLGAALQSGAVRDLDFWKEIGASPERKAGAKGAARRTGSAGPGEAGGPWWAAGLLCAPPAAARACGAAAAAAHLISGSLTWIRGLTLALGGHKRQDQEVELFREIEARARATWRRPTGRSRPS